MDTDLHSDLNLRSPQRQLIELRMEHADLDNLIDRAVEQAPVDDLALRRLKKRRLMLRDRIARLESGHARAHCLDDAGCVIPQHRGGTRCRRHIAAHFGVDRIDRNRLDAHQQVAAGRNRIRQFDVDETARIVDGQALGVTDGFHGGPISGEKRREGSPGSNDARFRQ
jgi:hypothetical protein